MLGDFHNIQTLVERERDQRRERETERERERERETYIHNGERKRD